ncbi:GlsB/YeaQ/YmgE family stress response membrane protein [Variovorax humicola]|uniref:GlsB/YeaQ/YmgE family stress response membrane protein n=1 Tax=Variovorax humicola TaxID=1769758 RepID=A0ABU8WAT8_9BURK
MNFIIWLVVGGLIGWIASMIMRTDAQQGAILNVVVGIIGSMIGGWVIAPLLGSATVNQNDFSLRGLLASLLGAVILLAVVNLVRRGTAR